MADAVAGFESYASFLTFRIREDHTVYDNKSISDSSPTEPCINNDVLPLKVWPRVITQGDWAVGRRLENISTTMRRNLMS